MANVKRGDTVSFSYRPSRFDFSKASICHISYRALVEKVIRERQVVVVKVWSGASISCLDPDYYEQIEIPIVAVTVVKKKEKR